MISNELFERKVLIKIPIYFILTMISVFIATTFLNVVAILILGIIFSVIFFALLALWITVYFSFYFNEISGENIHVLNYESYEFIRKEGYWFKEDFITAKQYYIKDTGNEIYYFRTLIDYILYWNDVYLVKMYLTR